MIITIIIIMLRCILCSSPSVSITQQLKRKRLQRRNS